MESNITEEVALPFKIDFFRIFKEITSYIILHALLFLCIASISMVVFYKISKIEYSATATLLKKQNYSPITVGTSSFIHPPVFSLSAIAETIGTIPNMEKVIARIGLNISAWELYKKVHVSPSGHSEIIRIRCVHEDPKLAAFISNVLADITIESDALRAAEEADKYLMLYDKEAQKEIIMLNDLNKKVLEYLNEQDIVNVEAEKSSYLERLTSMQTSYDETQLALNKLKQQRQTLHTLWKSSPASILEEAVITNPQIQGKIEELEWSLAQSRSKYTDNHPYIQKLLRELHVAEELFREDAYTRTLTNLDRQIKTYQSNGQQILQSINELNKKVDSLPEKDLVYEQFIKERNEIQSRLNHYEKVKEQAKIIKEGQFSNLQIASYAVIPQHKTKKFLTSKAIIASVSIGLFTVLFLIALRIVLTYKIKTAKELELHFEDNPVLLQIPFVKDIKKLVDLHIIEKMQLRRLYNGAGRAIILVTSIFPDEGSTYSSFVILKELVKRYNSVCYVHFSDKAIQDVYVKFEMDKHALLLDYLDHRVPLSQIAIPTSISNLTLINAAHSTEDYEKVLRHSGLAGCLRELNEQYSIVILDCKSMMADYGIPVISEEVEAVFLVVASGTHNKKTVEKALEQLKLDRYSNVYFILNKVRKRFIKR